MIQKRPIQEIDMFGFLNYINEHGINTVTRKTDTLWSRYVCFDFLHKRGYTSTNIALIFDKDHATILNGLKFHAKNKNKGKYKILANELTPVLQSFIVGSLDVCLNEMISLAYLESEMQKKLLP